MPNQNIHPGLKIAALIGFILFIALQSASLIQAVTHRDAPTMTRAEAAAAAEWFVRDALDLSEDAELRSFAVYLAEQEAIGYLNRSGSAESGDGRLGTVFPLELYRVEVVDAENDAVHFIDINPFTGEPAEWEFYSDWDVSSVLVSGAEAESAAREALAAYGWDGTELRLVSSETGDGALEFEARDVSFGDAFVRLAVKVGNEGGIFALAANWNVPEAYAALAERQDAAASLLGSAGLAASGLLQAAAFIYALARMKEARWGRGAVMALIFGLFYCIYNLNMYPAWKASFYGWADGGSALEGSAGLTDGAVAASMITFLMMVNSFTMAMAFGMYFSAVSGDLLARRGLPPVWPAPSEPGYRRSIVSGMAKGYMFAPLLLGVQSVLMLLAGWIWQYWETINPLTSPKNLAYPLLLPLIAWCAAVEEEVVFRLFAIPALAGALAWIARKLGRSRRRPPGEGAPYPAAALAIAAVASSMIWALGHVQYPIYPFYTRFVEVTILGLLFTYIFMRHGLFAAIFTHATFDLVWSAFALAVYFPSAESIAAAIFYLATPALAAGLAMLRKRSGPKPVPPAEVPAS